MFCDRAFVAWVLLSCLVRVQAQIPQSLSTCVGPSTTTVSSSADATSLAACQVYKGDIVIAKSVTGVVSLAGIQQITGTLTCRNVTGLTSLAASSLKTVEGSFDLENLADLSSLEFPSLVSVGNGLNINKTSTNLTTISGFPKLSSVGGSLHLGGAFNSISFNSLKNVSGDAVLITSSTNNSLCLLLSAASRNRIIKGQIRCSTNDTSSLADIPKTDEDPERQNRGLGAGKITGIVIGAIFGALLIAGLILWLCHFRPKKQQKQDAVWTKPKQDPNEGVESGEVTEYYGSKPPVTTTAMPIGAHERPYEQYQYPPPTSAMRETSVPASAPPVPSGLRSHPTTYPTYDYNSIQHTPVPVAVPAPTPSPVSPIDNEPVKNHVPTYPASSRYSGDFEGSDNMYDPPRLGLGFDRTKSPRTDMMEYQQAQTRFGREPPMPAAFDRVGRTDDDIQYGKSSLSPMPSILRPGRSSQGYGNTGERTMREI